jgi:two-component system, NtrC family, sensor kinase
MAKAGGRAGKRTMAAGRDGPQARKSSAPKATGTESRKANPTKLTRRKQKPAPASETASLREQLKTATLRQEATAEILKAVANAAGDATYALQVTTETTARLFSASSVRIRLVKDGEWGSTFHVGPSSDAVRSAVPDAKARIGGRNLPGTVVTENRQIHIPDLDDIPLEMADWPGLPPARAAGARVISGTPLRRGSEAIGVLIIHRDRPIPFTPEELALQQSFADQAVIAIENARLFNEVQAKTRDLSESLQYQTATADVLKVISRSVFDLQAVLDTLVESAHQLCGANLGLLYLKGEEAFECRAIAGSGVEEASRHFKGRPIRAGRATAAERVILTGEVQSITDFFSDREFDPAAKQMIRNAAESGLGVLRSTLAVPMIRDNVVIGVLVIASSQTGPFPSRQIELLRTFADQAVIAIENVRLFEQVQAKTRDLQDALTYQTGSASILRVIASSPTDVEPVLEAIVERARELCEADDAIVLLKEDDHLRFSAHSGPIPVNIDKRPIGPGWTAGLAFLNQKPVHIHDMLSGEGAQFPDARAMGQGTGAIIRTVLSVPLLRERESVGAILLRRTDVRPFNDKQINLLSTFADQAVIAIENTRLFNETKEALERQTATSEILRVISRSPTDVSPVFEAIAQTAVRLIGCDRAFIQRCDDQCFWSVAYCGPEGQLPMLNTSPVAIDPAANFPSRAIIEKKTVHLPDWSTIELPDHERAIHDKLGISSALYLPLLRDGDCIGLLTMAGIRANTFSATDIALAESFRDQALIAIENVRLFDEVQAKTRDLTESLQQQTATADVLKVISRSAFDLQTVLETLIRSAVELAGAQRGAIFLRDGEQFRFQVASYTDLYPEWIQFLKDNPQNAGQHSAIARAIEGGQVVCIPDVRADPDITIPAALAGIRAVLAVPLLRDGKVEGIMALSRQIPAAFTERQIDLVQTFADQAVIAIENVRLFEEVQTRTKELSLSLDELRTAQDRLVQTEKLASLGQLTAGIAHEIKNPLNFVNNFSALSAELIDELNDALKPAKLDDKVRDEIDELTEMLKGNLEKVVQHGKRADSIVKNMLLHSREGSGEHRPADINAIVEESLNLAYHGARAEKPGFNITLQRDLDPAAGMIDIYPQEMTRVFLNLISNGFYAAAKRKEAGDEGFEPTLKATTKSLGNKVEIRFRDNGTGIPPEVRERMFNPFFTTKPAGEGTGLGLSMSHDIVVKQHGGKIEVDTTPGAFTEFIITLPRSAAAQQPAGGTN